MKLFIFKQDRTNLWWACIVTPGGGFEPAAPFLTWESALRSGLEKLKNMPFERQKQRDIQELKMVERLGAWWNS